jgi:hypothetical protein
MTLSFSSFRDIATAQLGLGDYKAAHNAFEVLQKRNNWSKALYTYATVVSLYQSSTSSTPSDEITSAMQAIPTMGRRIAGKSIPIEKFAARKSKKFMAQGRLMLPALELSFLLMALAQAPQFIIRDNHLVLIDEKIAELDAVLESERGTWGSGGWYDGAFQKLQMSALY